MAEITTLRPKRKRAKCPICRKPTEERFRPFCSKRCADIDLGRWLDGAYRVETDEAPSQAAAGDGNSEEE